MLENEPSFDDLINNLISAKHDKVQEALIIEKITGAGSEYSAKFLRYLWQETLKKRKDHSEIYMSFIQSIHRNNLINTEEFQEIKEYALRNDIQEIAYIFEDLPPQLSIEDDLGTVDNLGMEDLPLGVKKSFAKKIDKRTINKLLHEQDPSVIEILLQNPSIVEHDVLKIVTKRPTSHRVIKQVFLQRKWIARYTIKRAIVLNPYSPPCISIALLPFLQRLHLEEVAEDRSLHEVVRLISRNALGY